MIFFFGSPGLVLVAVLVLVLLATARAALPLAIVGLLAFAFLPLAMLVVASALCALLLSVVLMLPVLVGRPKRPYGAYLAQATLLVIGAFFIGLGWFLLRGLPFIWGQMPGTLVVLAIGGFFVLVGLGFALAALAPRPSPAPAAPPQSGPAIPTRPAASPQSRRLHGTSDYDLYRS